MSTASPIRGRTSVRYLLSLSSPPTHTHSFHFPFPARPNPTNLPILAGSVLGFPRSTQEFVYFNRTDVQDAIHAPHIVWESCGENSVYVNTTTGRAINDQSIPSALSVLPNVIEKSTRTVIAHGLADYDLIAEGARIVLPNMTCTS